MTIKTLRPGAELHYPLSFWILQLGEKVAEGNPAACFVEPGDAYGVTDTGMSAEGWEAGSEEGKAKPLLQKSHVSL